MANADRCVCCGEIIPEGSHVCPNCKVAVKRDDSVDAYAFLVKYMKENMPKKETEAKPKRKRMIDANAAIRAIERESLKGVKEKDFIFLPAHDFFKYCKAIAISFLKDTPTVDAVFRGVHDQVRWERDIAMEQLSEHGIPFGGMAPDVVKVVRCKDCKHYNVYRLECHNGYMNGRIGIDGFCSYGERKDNEL